MVINGIDTKDISVVVQGAVDRENTPKCLRSIRKHLPEATIILSTWERSETDSIHSELYDELIKSDDPGAFPCDAIPNSVMNNVNRQIVSSYQGVMRCKTEYVVKMRTDFYMTGSGFLSYYSQFKKYDEEYRYFSERIIACTVYSRNPRSTVDKLVMPYCPSDFFFFGKKKDIIKLFDRDIIKDIDEKMFFELHPEYKTYLNYKDALCQFMPEQTIWMGFLQRYVKNLDCICRDHITKNNIVLTERSFANNLILCSPEQIGIYAFNENLFYKGIPENCLTHDDWLCLYKYYCENDKYAIHEYIQRTKERDQEYKNGKRLNTTASDEKNAHQKTVSIHNLHDVIVKCERYSYISFDIFDTLLLRYSSPDWQAMAQTNEHISMLLGTRGIEVTTAEIDSAYNNFVDIRNRKRKLEGKSEEYCVRDVICDVLTYYGISKVEVYDLCEAVIQNEVAREIAGIYVNPEAVDVLDTLKRQGKRIVAITDMYLSLNDINTILDNFNIRSYFERIFVSSEYGYTKADGKLFRYVLEDLKIKHSDIIHIGDNIISDVRNAQENGISNLYYYSVFNIRRKQKLEKQIIDGYPKDYIGNAFSIAGSNTSYREYISSYFSFDIINFVFSAASEIYRNGIESVFFLARDGTLYGEIYRKLIDEVILLKGLPKVKCVDLKLSRKDTACLVNIESPRDVIKRGYAVNPPNRFHIIHVLGCFGLSIHDFETDVQKEIVNHNSDLAYFEFIYPNVILPKLRERRHAVLDYLEHNDFFSRDRIAIVDIGWGGTSQKDIISYFKTNKLNNICFGYYYACDDRANELTPYYYRYHYGPELYFAYSLLEFIVKDYTEKDKQTWPQTENGKYYFKKTYELNKLARAQIISDVKTFVDGVNKYHLTPKLICEYTLPKLKEMINNPPDEFLNYLSEVQFSLDRKKDDTYQFLFQEALTVTEIDNQYETAQWVQASKKISSIPVKSVISARELYHKTIDSPKVPQLIKKIAGLVSNCYHRLKH